MKVTVTERAELDARADFFTTGDAEKLVYCASAAVADARARLGPVATVVDGGRPVEMRRLSEDLGDRGVRAADGRGRRHRAHAVPDRRPRRRAAARRRARSSSATRGPRGSSATARFPWNPDRRATLAEVRQIGDVVLLRYALSPRFRTD